MPLEKFFTPQSIAIIGATEDPQNITSVIYKNLDEMGYEGQIVPINPHHDKVFGVLCYPSLLEVTDVIDLAVIAIPAIHVLAVIEQLKGCGIEHAIIISGGFGELGDRGRELEEEIKGVCTRDGIHIIGPNCIGIFDNYSNFTTSFLPWDKVERPRKGSVSILTQSGSYAVSLMDLLAQEGIGVSKVVSYGNRVDIGESALIEYLIDDDSTRVIGIYMESVDDGRRFITASSRCTETKHMVALKVGRGDFGIKAIRSHTGAIAGKYEIYRAAFRESGILEVDGLEEFIDACKVLSMQNPARGNRILVITNGGGFGVAVSDRCSVEGLDVAKIPGTIKEELSKEFPGFYILNNPIDITGSSGDKDFGTVLKAAFIDDYFFDAAIVIPLMPPPTMTEGVVDIVSQKARESRKPVIVCTIGGKHTKKLKLMFEGKGIPVFTSPERCVKAMSILVKRGEMCGDKRQKEQRVPYVVEREKPKVLYPEGYKEVEKIIKKIGGTDKGIVSPHYALEIIKAMGIATPTYLLVKTQSEAVEAARLLGFPVVLKVSTSAVLHKSDVGGVAVDVRTEEEVKNHYNEIMRNLSKKRPDIDIKGVVVEKQVMQTIEVIVGAIRDEQFGPTVMVGLGGIFVEILNDVSFGMAPVTERVALMMIEEIKGYRILSGYRGTKMLDIPQLVKTVVVISELISNINGIKEIELNPLRVYGKGVIAVDARIILEQKSIDT